MEGTRLKEIESRMDSCRKKLDSFQKKVTQFGLIGYLLYQLRFGVHSREYRAQYDQFQILYLIVPCALVSLVVHSHLNNNILADMSWAFALSLESLCGKERIFFRTRCNPSGVAIIVNLAHW